MIFPAHEGEGEVASDPVDGVAEAPDPDPEVDGLGGPPEPDPVVAGVG